MKTNEINKDSIQIWDDSYKSTFWHTSAHLLAYALESLFPGIKLGTGPAIENGFYYDVDFGDYSFTDKDFKKVEQKMFELAKKSFENIRKEVSKRGIRLLPRKRR